MFLKFSCGCVGVEHKERYWVFKMCDAAYADPDLLCVARPMTIQGQRQLSLEEAHKLCEELHRMLIDGHKFRELKGLLQ